MAILNIRQLPDDVHTSLRVRAARNGRSMEAEARYILTLACAGGDRAYGPSAGSGQVREGGGPEDSLAVVLPPRLAAAVRDHASRQHTTVEDLVRLVLDREFADDARRWCDEIFARMDAAGGNSQGARWTRDELYER